MRFFNKKPTQEAINALKNYYREKKEHSDWNDNTFDKAAVRTSLVMEQGYLCAYCMQRIEDAHTTTIEHWVDRASLKASGNIQEIFEYNNLLAVCKGHLYRAGGKGKHCDASRSDGNRPLSVKPSEKKTVEAIGYATNGRIYAKCALNALAMDENLCEKYQEKKDKSYCEPTQKCAHCDLDCDKGLNLNLLSIMDNRKQLLRDLARSLNELDNEKFKNLEFSKKERLKKQIITQFVNQTKDGKLKPYIGIIESRYKKYL